MKRYRATWIIVLAIAALHVSTYVLHLDGFAKLADRNVYFCASAGMVLVGSLDLGSLSALAPSRPAFNLSLIPRYEIEGMGSTHMKLRSPSSGSVESPIWPGVALPVLLLLILPVGYAVTLAARSAEHVVGGNGG